MTTSTGYADAVARNLMETRLHRARPGWRCRCGRCRHLIVLAALRPGRTALGHPAEAAGQGPAAGARAAAGAPAPTTSGAQRTRRYRDDGAARRAPGTGPGGAGVHGGTALTPE